MKKYLVGALVCPILFAALQVFAQTQAVIPVEQDSAVSSDASKTTVKQQIISEADQKATKEAELKTRAEKKAKDAADKKAAAEARARAEAEEKAAQAADQKAGDELELKEKLASTAKANAEKQADEVGKARKAVQKISADKKAAEEAKQKAREDLSAKEIKAQEAAAIAAAREADAKKAAEDLAALRQERVRAKQKIEAETREAELKAAAEKKAKETADKQAAAEIKAKAEAEKKARQEAEARSEQEAKVRKEAEKKAVRDAELKAEAEQAARVEAERKALADARAKAKAEKEAKEAAEKKAAAEARARAEAEEKAAQAADQKAGDELELKEKLASTAKANAEKQADEVGKARKAVQKISADKKAAEKAKQKAREDLSAKEIKAQEAAAIATAREADAKKAAEDLAALRQERARAKQKIEAEARERKNAEKNAAIEAKIRAQEEMRAKKAGMQEKEKSLWASLRESFKRGFDDAAKPDEAGKWKISVGVMQRRIHSQSFKTYSYSENYNIPAMAGDVFRRYEPAGDLNSYGDRRYDDGYVLKDDYTDLDGGTENWDGGQIQNGAVAFHYVGRTYTEYTRSKENTVGETHNNSDREIAPYIQLDRVLYRHGWLDAGLHLDFSRASFSDEAEYGNFSDRQQWENYVQYVEDVYSLAGAPVIDNIPDMRRAAGTVQTGAYTYNAYNNIQQSLDMNLGTMSLGMLMSLNYWRLSLAGIAGPTFNYVNLQTSYSETLYASMNNGSPETLQTWNDSQDYSECKFGGFVQAQLGLRVIDGLGVGIFGRYDWMENMSGNIGQSRYMINPEGGSLGGTVNLSF